MRIFVATSILVGVAAASSAATLADMGYGPGTMFEDLRDKPMLLHGEYEFVDRLEGLEPTEMMDGSPGVYWGPGRSAKRKVSGFEGDRAIIDGDGWFMTIMVDGALATTNPSMHGKKAADGTWTVWMAEEDGAYTPMATGASRPAHWTPAQYARFAWIRQGFEPAEAIPQADGTLLMKGVRDGNSHELAVDPTNKTILSHRIIEADGTLSRYEEYGGFVEVHGHWLPTTHIDIAYDPDGTAREERRTTVSFSFPSAAEARVMLAAEPADFDAMVEARAQAGQ